MNLLHQYQHVVQSKIDKISELNPNAFKTIYPVK